MADDDYSLCDAYPFADFNQLGAMVVEIGATADVGAFSNFYTPHAVAGHSYKVRESEICQYRQETNPYTLYYRQGGALIEIRHC